MKELGPFLPFMKQIATIADARVPSAAAQAQAAVEARAGTEAEVNQIANAEVAEAPLQAAAEVQAAVEARARRKKNLSARRRRRTKSVG